MAVLSVLSKFNSSLHSYIKLGKFLLRPKNKTTQNCIRSMSDHGPKTMYITPTRFQWRKCKDDVHFFAALGIIPLTILITCVNIFIGPAELSEIPEGYEPEYWEYYKHPISRFISRNFHTNPQEDYERMLHLLNEEQERLRWKDLIKKTDRLQRDREDYRGWYFTPFHEGKAYREARRESDVVFKRAGYL